MLFLQTLKTHLKDVLNNDSGYLKNVLNTDLGYLFNTKDVDETKPATIDGNRLLYRYNFLFDYNWYISRPKNSAGLSDRFSCDNWRNLDYYFPRR